MQGKLNQALASMQQERRYEGQLAGLALVYYAMGRKADSDAALNAMQQDSSRSQPSVLIYPSDFARIYAFRAKRSARSAISTRHTKFTTPTSGTSRTTRS